MNKDIVIALQTLRLCSKLKLALVANERQWEKENFLEILFPFSKTLSIPKKEFKNSILFESMLNSAYFIFGLSFFIMFSCYK
jgi:hypothetical protein